VAGAAAAQTQDMSSPYDTNPKCSERTSDGSSAECVLQQEGEPRHTYPPPKTTPTPPPSKPPAAPESKARDVVRPPGQSGHQSR
jgi:hypothetical protein